jgi:hypothetical protein
MPWRRRRRLPLGLAAALATLALLSCAPGEEAAAGAGADEAVGAASDEAAAAAAGEAEPAESSSWTAREPATIEWTQRRPDVADAPALVDSAAREARLTVLDGVHRVVLPPPAHDALRRAAPGFRPWTPGQFLEILFQPGFYEFDEEQAMAAVVADFDGDGRRDVVMRGTDGGQVLTVSLLSGNGEWRYQEISRRDPYGRELEARASGTYLMVLPPGSYEQPEFLDEPPVVIETAGFQNVIFEKGYVAYYLRDGEWRRMD